MQYNFYILSHSCRRAHRIKSTNRLWWAGPLAGGRFYSGGRPPGPSTGAVRNDEVKWKQSKENLVLLSRPNFLHNNLIQQTLSGVHSRKAKIPQPTHSITPNSIEKWTVILYTSNTLELRVKTLKRF